MLPTFPFLPTTMVGPLTSCNFVCADNAAGTVDREVSLPTRFSIFERFSVAEDERSVQVGGRSQPSGRPSIIFTCSWPGKRHRTNHSR